MQFKDKFLIGNYSIDLYNSIGHRCKELSDLNIRNHILIVGDTAGIQAHLPIEETFPNILSKKLKVDYYNLCIKDGGVDALKYNLFVWLHKVGKPKTIIIACEYANAILSTDINSIDLYPSNLNDPIVQETIESANYCGFFNGRNELFNKLLYHSNNIPVYQLTWSNQTPLLTEKVSNIQCDQLNQSEIADLLYKEISHKLSAARNI